MPGGVAQHHSRKGVRHRSCGGPAIARRRRPKRVPRSLSSISIGVRSKGSGPGHGRARRWRSWWKRWRAESRPSWPSISCSPQTDTRSPAALARQLGNVTGNQDILCARSRSSRRRQRLAAAIKDEATVLGFVLDADAADARPGRAGAGARPVRSTASGARPAASRRSAADRRNQGARRALSAGRRRWKDQACASPRRRRRHGTAGLCAGDGEAGQACAGAYDRRRSLRITLAISRCRCRVMPCCDWHGLRRASAIGTISAADIIDRPGAAGVANAVVLIGRSAPELGGLRDTPDDPLRALGRNPGGSRRADSFPSRAACDPGRSRTRSDAAHRLIALAAASLPMSPVAKPGLPGRPGARCGRVVAGIPDRATG